MWTHIENFHKAKWKVVMHKPMFLRKIKAELLEQVMRTFFGDFQFKKESRVGIVESIILRGFHTPIENYLSGYSFLYLEIEILYTEIVFSS